MAGARGGRVRGSQPYFLQVPASKFKAQSLKLKKSSRIPIPKRRQGKMSANKAVRAPSRISLRGPPDFGAFKLELFLSFELFLTSSLNFILGPGRAELRILRMRPD